MSQSLTSLDVEKLVVALANEGASLDIARESLAYMQSALALGRSDLFRNYVRWRAGFETHRSQSTLSRILDMMHQATGRVPEVHRTAWSAYVTDARQVVGTKDAPPASDEIQVPKVTSNDLARGYLAALLASDRRAAARLIVDAADAGASIQSIYLDVLEPCLREVGYRWETGRLSTGQEHYCTAVTQSIMGMLAPRIFSGKRRGRRLIATSVMGNLHEIGIRMVADLFELDGWDTFYLGADCPDEAVVTAVTEHNAHAVAISVMLSSQLPAAATTIASIRAVDAVGQIPILVGGRAFAEHPELAKRMGADVCVTSAVQAIDIANELTRSS